jgi:Zn-dependent protease
MEQIVNGMIWYMVFLFSTTVHEAAHAFTAMKLGDNTAFLGGQVTLNPLPHVQREPIGTVVVPILSMMMSGFMIGWASAPYDPYWAQRYPKRAAWMSLAGPASNLLLVLISAGLIHVGMAVGWFIEPESVNFTQVAIAADEAGPFVAVAMILSIMFTLNLLLCVFNLIPFPPLDGSGALPLLLSEELASNYTNFISNSTFSFLGLFIAWNIFDKVFNPIHLMAINLLYPGGGYH